MGIHASTLGRRSWLEKRDAASSEFEDDLVKALDDDDDDTGLRKRQKPNPNSSDLPKKPLPGRGTFLRAGLKLQPRIDKALTKQVQSSDQMRKDAISSLAEEQAAAAERLRQRQIYVPPPPDQRDLHEMLHDDGNDSDAQRSSLDSSSDTDPAGKSPEKLTVQDKWLLCEEYFLITGIAGIDPSADFLAMHTPAKTGWIPLHLHPDSLVSWSQRELEILFRMRKNHPNGQVFQDRQSRNALKKLITDG